MNWNRLRIFNLLRKNDFRLNVIAFYPPQVDDFLNFLFNEYDLIFPKRGVLESTYRRKFPQRGKKEIRVDFYFLPSVIPSIKENYRVNILITRPAVPILEIENVNKLLILFPDSFSFSCSFFGIPCTTWDKALSVIWEGGSCRRECHGVWELFFGKGWFYYQQNGCEKQLSFNSFTVNGRKAEKAEKIYALLKEARMRKKSLKLTSMEDILLIPIGKEMVLKLHEHDNNPSVTNILRAALEVESTFLGKNFTYKFLSFKETLTWKEEKNAYLPEPADSFLRSCSVFQER